MAMKTKPPRSSGVAGCRRCHSPSARRVAGTAPGGSRSSMGSPLRRGSGPVTVRRPTGFGERDQAVAQLLGVGDEQSRDDDAAGCRRGDEVEVAQPEHARNGTAGDVDELHATVRHRDEPLEQQPAAEQQVVVAQLVADRPHATRHESDDDQHDHEHRGRERSTSGVNRTSIGGKLAATTRPMVDDRRRDDVDDRRTCGETRRQSTPGRSRRPVTRTSSALSPIERSRPGPPP